MKGSFLLVACGAIFTGCGTAEPDKPAPAAVVIPETLRPFGEGFPARDSPCRRLGETPATSNYLDHTAMLIGCPGTRESAVVQAVVAAGGRIVSEIDGVVLLTVPSGNP
jgi:hypothetical protein